MIEIKLLFGKEEVNYYLNNNKLTNEIETINVKTYEFKTEKEYKAFMRGINEGIGWQEALVIEKMHNNI